MAFATHLEANLFTLQDELRGGLYAHELYEPFTVRDPKKRRIHKATVRDRVVHQALTQVIEPLFEPQFIYDSFSCRVGKGTHAAVQRLHRFLLRASLNKTKTVHVLKCDVRKFFDSVDHQILMSLIKRKVSCEKTLRLIRAIVDTFCTSPGKGIPLGNLTSQLFANIYLNELDRFVKHTMKEKYYLRYCDDFILVSYSRAHLFERLPLIADFLWSTLALRLHPTKVSVRSWGQGIDFLGYILLPHCTILRTTTKRRMVARVNGENISSYLGLCQHADSFETQQIIMTKIGFV